MMDKDLKFKKSMVMNAPVSKVWDALTRPEIIKDYFFGTETITDWKKGGSIVFQGEYEGKAYMDKGTILNIEKDKSIEYTYWSSFSGVEESPDNYSTIKYELKPVENGTEFTLTQTGFKNAEARDHSAANWAGVIDTIKKLVEK